MITRSSIFEIVISHVLSRTSSFLTGGTRGTVQGVPCCVPAGGRTEEVIVVERGRVTGSPRHRSRRSSCKGYLLKVPVSLPCNGDSGRPRRGIIEETVGDSVSEGDLESLLSQRRDLETETGTRLQSRYVGDKEIRSYERNRT